LGARRKRAWKSLQRAGRLRRSRRTRRTLVERWNYRWTGEYVQKITPLKIRQARHDAVDIAHPHLTRQKKSSRPHAHGRPGDAAEDQIQDSSRPRTDKVLDQEIYTTINRSVEKTVLP